MCLSPLISFLSLTLCKLTGRYREQNYILNKKHSEPRNVPQMLHGVTTATEQSGTQDSTVPYGYSLLAPFKVKHHRQATIVAGPTVLEPFKARKGLAHAILFEH